MHFTFIGTKCVAVAVRIFFSFLVFFCSLLGRVRLKCERSRWFIWFGENWERPISRQITGGESRGASKFSAQPWCRILVKFTACAPRNDRQITLTCANSVPTEKKKKKKKKSGPSLLRKVIYQVRRCTYVQVVGAPVCWRRRCNLSRGRQRFIKFFTRLAECFTLYLYYAFIQTFKMTNDTC